MRETKFREIKWFFSELNSCGTMALIIFGVAFAIVGGIGAGVAFAIYLIRLALGY